MSFFISQEIEDALFDFVVDVLSLDKDKVLWARGNQIRPSRPFVVLNIFAAPASIGRGEIMYSGLKDRWNLSFQKAFTLSIDVFSDDNYLDQADQLLNAFELSKYKEIFKAINLGYWGQLGVVDLSDLEETKIRPRVKLDVRMAYGKTIVDDMGEIEKVELTTNFGGNEDDIVIDNIFSHSLDFSKPENSFYIPVI